MANVVLPIIIQGPAYITHGGVTLFTQQDVTVTPNIASWNPASSYGPLGERFISRSYTITATPVGQLNATLIEYLYAAHLAPGDAVGHSIIPLSNDALVINSIAEMKKYTYHRAGLSRPPNLVLSPAATAFGPAEWTALIDGGVQPENAAAYKTNEEVLASVATSFEESEIVTDIYSAALGARSSPFNAMGSMDGFTLEFPFNLAPVTAGDVGVADIFLAGLSLAARFIPSNLSEANLDTLLAVQNTGAVLPGQSFAKASEDLVITGTQSGWVFTAKQVGAKEDSGRIYQTGQHRHRGLVFAHRRVWTAGVEVAQFAYTSPS